MGLLLIGPTLLKAWQQCSSSSSSSRAACGSHTTGAAAHTQELEAACMVQRLQGCLASIGVVLVWAVQLLLLLLVLVAWLIRAAVAS
jgi:hypothetical protein